MLHKTVTLAGGTAQITKKNDGVMTWLDKITAGRIRRMYPTVSVTA